MRFFVLTLLLLTCCARPVFAKTFNAETFTLENGLQVVVIPNHRAPVVVHMVWYKFGGADEKPGESGIAHFLEHLMFKGTEKVPEGQFSFLVKKFGGNENAFTSQDYTAYFQEVALDHLPDVMEMEADRMKNLNLKEEQIASERQVIIEERRQRIDSQPQAKFQEQLRSTLFVNHPYAVPVIGWLNEMKQLTRDQALFYYKTWYAPNNAIVIVSGDITAEQLKPLAEKYYGSIPFQALPERIRPRPAPIIADHRITMKDPRIGLVTLTKNYRVPRGNDAMEIMAEILGGTSTSRLYKNLVVNKKLALAAGADYDSLSLDDTIFTIYVSPVPGISLTDLESALDLEIKNLLEKGVTLEELQSAKDRKMADFIYTQDSLMGPAMLFGQAMTSGLTIDDLEDWKDRIEKLSIEDVNKAADSIFESDDLPVTGVLLPEEKAKE